MQEMIASYLKHKDLTRINRELETMKKHYPETEREAFYFLKHHLDNHEEKQYKKKQRKVIRNKHAEPTEEETTYLKQPCHWIDAREKVTVQGYTLTKGDFYLGEQFLIPKRIIDSILESFDTLGYGVTPDYRISGPRLKEGSRCILFTKTKKAMPEPDENYTRMQAIVKLAVILMQTDGKITPQAEEHLLQFINTREEDRDG